MRSPTVLVVDDDPDLRTILQSVLVSEGYQVSTAADGEHALRHTEHGLIDVIVMDVTMPHLSGLQVCHLLRQRGDHTPVLLLSGLAAGSDRAAGLTAGADDYLTKPFHLDEVLAHVQALLPSDPAEERPNVGGG
jgi:DNA-binding response OmpR family regulator